MRLSFATFMLIAATWPALAALPGTANPVVETASLSAPPVESDDGLLDTLVAAIEGGKASFGLAAPAQAADVAERLNALKSFRGYVESVIGGLGRADAETNMFASVAERLAGLSVSYDAYVFAELRTILDPALVGSDGWVNCSRFGADAEAMAGELVAHTADDHVFLGALAARLRQLAARGEASRGSVELIDARLAEVQAQRSSTRGARLSP